MFWLDNISELTKSTIIPDINMTIEEKINTIIRFILFVGLICSLIFNDTRYILFVIIIMIFSILIINYQYEKNMKIEKYLNLNDLDIVDNTPCVKPTESNPFMNPNVLNINDDSAAFSACPITDNKTCGNMDKLYFKRIFRNTDDIYDKATQDRQFYTVPSTTFPNNREDYIEWLYNRGPSCKEGNGLKCYTNLYNNVKNSVKI